MDLDSQLSDCINMSADIGKSQQYPWKNYNYFTEVIIIAKRFFECMVFISLENVHK